jgi:hypothetical protein
MSAHTKAGRPKVHPLKDEATFDPELGRYVLPSERRVNKPRHDNSELDKKSTEN